MISIAKCYTNMSITTSVSRYGFFLLIVLTSTACFSWEKEEKNNEKDKKIKRKEERTEYIKDTN